MLIATKRHRGPRSHAKLRTKPRSTPERIGLMIFLLIIVAVIVTPLVAVVVRSLQERVGLLDYVFSLNNYTALLTPELLVAGWNSLVTAFGAMLVAVVLGVTISWLVARTDIPGRSAFEILNLIPFFLSPLIGSIAWTYLGDPRTGFLNRLVHSIGGPESSFSIYSLGGIILVLGLYKVPFVILLTSGAFRQMDSSLEQAAYTSGASGWRTIMRITVPLAGPSIIAAAILVFVMAIEDLSVPLTLGYSHGIQTLGTQMYNATVQSFPPNYNFGAAIGVVMMVITAGCLYFQRRAMRNRGFTTVTGKGSHPEQLRLGSVGRWVGFAVDSVYLLLAAVLPLGVLAIIAFSKRWTGVIDFSNFTIDNFTGLFHDGSVVIPSFLNSFALSIVCATVAIMLSVLIVYTIERAKITGRRIFEVLLTIPVAVPGLVLGVGLFALLQRTPLYGTLGLIAIAYIVRFLPFAQRSVSGAFLSVHTELEEAARISGASLWRYIWKILLPLVRPGMIAGWLLVFLTFMRELPMSALLQTTQTQTLSVALLNSIAFNPPGQTAAFTLLQALILLLAAGIFWVTANRSGRSASVMAAAL